MRKHILKFAIVLCLVLTSCGSTRPFVEGFASDPSLPLEQKLVMGGGIKVSFGCPEMYFDASAFLDRYIELIEGAEEYVIITTFLGSSSGELKELYDAIADKASSGVPVYMIIDGISSYDMTASASFMTPLYFLRESGVHLIEYNPLSILNVIHPSSLLVREHRKLVVIDGQWAVLGGMNMNYISMGAGDIDLQRDSMYVFDSPSLAACLVDEFVSIWNESSVEKIDRNDFADKPAQDGDITGYLFNQGPGGHADMASMYSSLFSSAEEEIVMLPYLAFFDDNMYASLKAAQNRGVKVRIYLPIDSRAYVQGALFYDYHRLVEAGFDVFIEFAGEDTGLSLLHQKLAVIDGRYTVIGSSNINYRSMTLSHEIALVIDSVEFASASLAQVEELKKNMAPLDEETALRLKEEKGSWPMYLFSFYGG